VHEVFDEAVEDRGLASRRRPAASYMTTNEKIRAIAN